jgi:hypothetical protein
MIDLDMALYLEYDDRTREPLCLVEAARDVGQARKAHSVTQRLAERAGVPAFCVLYRFCRHGNPADARVPDIQSFRIKRIHPQPERDWRTLTPLEWANALLRIREWQARRLKKTSHPQHRTQVEVLRKAAARIRRHPSRAVTR